MLAQVAKTQAQEKQKSFSARKIPIKKATRETSRAALRLKPE
jgi:hypothetical protein